MPTGWVFRIEIVSQKTPYTKEIMAELQRLFASSQVITESRIEELNEAVTLFKRRRRLLRLSVRHLVKEAKEINRRLDRLIEKKNSKANKKGGNLR